MPRVAGHWILQMTFYGSETFQNKAAKPWLRFAKVPPQIHDFRLVLQPSQATWLPV
jgi:hypothetical protein